MPCIFFRSVQWTVPSSCRLCLTRVSDYLGPAYRIRVPGGQTPGAVEYWWYHQNDRGAILLIEVTPTWRMQAGIKHLVGYPLFRYAACQLIDFNILALPISLFIHPFFLPFRGQFAESRLPRKLANHEGLFWNRCRRAGRLKSCRLSTHRSIVC